MPFESLSRKSKFHENMARIMRTLHKHVCTFMMITRWIILKWELLWTEVPDKIKTDTITFFRRSCCFWDYMEKSVAATHATDDCIILGMRFVHRLTKVQTHVATLPPSHNMQYLLLFYGNNNSMNVPQYYVIHTLCLLFILHSVNPADLENYFYHFLFYPHPQQTLQSTAILKVYHEHHFSSIIWLRPLSR